MPKTYLGNYDMTAIQTSNRAKAACIIVFAMAILILFLMLIIPFGNGVNVTEIYLRNYSTIAALLTMSLFFGKYNKLHKEGDCMHTVKVSTILLFIASLVKIGISIKFIITCIKLGNIVGIYYAGEIVVWAAVAFFSVAYFRRLGTITSEKTQAQIDEEDSE